MISDNALVKICKNPDCVHLGEKQSVSNFYVRSGIEFPTEPGHYISECKDCMKVRGKTPSPVAPVEPREFSERLAIDYLTSAHIPALPGKVFKASFIDVIAWGCVRIEVKYSSIRHYNCYFTFGLTNVQRTKGVLADVVMFICDYGDTQTFHFFDPADPIFTFLDGRSKSAITFDPNRIEQKKHTENRVSLTVSMMDHAQENISLIEDARFRISKNWQEEVIKWSKRKS